VDNPMAIRKVDMITRRGSCRKRHPNNIDFLTVIADLYREIHRPISTTWVKGYQDSVALSGSLSCNACNNIAVDALATKHQLATKSLIPRQHIPDLLSMQISVSINGLRLCGHIDKMI
jgi:hypothetical protein